MQKEGAKNRTNNLQTKNNTQNKTKTRDLKKATKSNLFEY